MDIQEKKTNKPRIVLIILLLLIIGCGITSYFLFIKKDKSPKDDNKNSNQPGSIIIYRDESPLSGVTYYKYRRPEFEMGFKIDTNTSDTEVYEVYNSGSSENDKNKINPIVIYRDGKDVYYYDRNSNSKGKLPVVKKDGYLSIFVDLDNNRKLIGIEYVDNNEHLYYDVINQKTLFKNEKYTGIISTISAVDTYKNNYIVARTKDKTYLINLDTQEKVIEYDDINPYVFINEYDTNTIVLAYSIENDVDKAYIHTLDGKLIYKGSKKHYSFDRQGNAYTYENNVINKYNVNGEVIFTQNNINGEIQSLYGNHYVSVLDGGFYYNSIEDDSKKIRLGDFASSDKYRFDLSGYYVFTEENSIYKKEGYYYNINRDLGNYDNMDTYYMYYYNENTGETEKIEQDNLDGVRPAINKFMKY